LQDLVNPTGILALIINHSSQISWEERGRERRRARCPSDVNPPANASAIIVSEYHY
jgi:hypothetical protein